MKSLNNYITESGSAPVHSFPIGKKKVFVSYKRKKYGYTPWDKENKHDDYAIIVNLGKDDESISYHWYDSIAHSGKITGFDEATAMSALVNGAMDAMAYKDASSLDDFAADFGYDDEKQAKQVYKACKELYDKFSSLFSDEDIRELSQLDDDIVL